MTTTITHVSSTCVTCVTCVCGWERGKDNPWIRTALTPHYSWLGNPKWDNAKWQNKMPHPEVRERKFSRGEDDWVWVGEGWREGGREGWGKGNEMKWMDENHTITHTAHPKFENVSATITTRTKTPTTSLVDTNRQNCPFSNYAVCVCVSVMAEIGSYYPSRQLKSLKVRYTWYVWSRWLYHIFYWVCRHYLVNRWFWTSQSGRRPSFLQDYLKWRTGCGDDHVYDWWITERQVCSTWVGMLLAGLWYETFCGHPVEDHRKLSVDHVGRYCR